MMKYLVGLTVAALAFAAPALSQSVRPCGERAQIVERLGEKYGETLTSMGLSHTNSVMEIYASEETGSWTILITSPSGQTCLIAAGEYWDAKPPMLTQSGQPT